ncbi:MAG: STAS domain-containing protein [Actinoallomurus sp.]
MLKHPFAEPAPAGGSIGTALAITSSVIGDQVSVGLAGEIDATNVDRLRTALFAHIDDGRTQVVVDVSGLTFIDCAGLGAIRAAAAHAEVAGGSLRLDGRLHPPVRRILQLTSASHRSRKII